MIPKYYIGFEQGFEKEFQEQESKKKDSQHNEERSRRGEWVVDTL